MRGNMRLHLFALTVGLLLAPAIAGADSTPRQPKYPPGWNCAAAPAGSQRQACNRSQLDPPMGKIPETTRTQQNGIALPQPEPPQLPAGPPPTIPRLPGTVDTGN